MLRRQKFNDKFEHYRKGHHEDWNEEDRQHIYRKLHVPCWSGGIRAWQGTRYADFQDPLLLETHAVIDSDDEAAAPQPIPAARPEQLDALDFSPPVSYDDDDDDDQAHPNAALARSRVRTMAVQLHREDWTFKKLLGWGGNGAAALFKHKDGRMWVVKTCLDQEHEEEILKEIAKLDRLYGGRHILRQTRNGRRTNPKMIFTEFYKRGTLTKTLVSAGEARGHRQGFNFLGLKNPLLWCLFDCLVDMAAGMTYPVRNWSDAKPQNAPRAAVQFPYDERVPAPAERVVVGNQLAAPARRGLQAGNPRMGLTPEQAADHAPGAPLQYFMPKQDWVHFDIDPSNSGFSFHLSYLPRCIPVKSRLGLTPFTYM